MRIAKSTRITLIIVAGIVILGISGLSVMSGRELDAADFAERLMTGLACLAAGMGIAGRTK